jgi:hypothetical protein
MVAPDYPNLGEIGAGVGREPERLVLSEVEQLRERAEKAEQGERDANRVLREQVANPPTPPVQARQPQAPPKPGEMPDPATDPEGFKTWDAATRRRDRWESDQNTERVRSDSENRVRSKMIVDEFITANPRYKNLRNHVFEYYREVAAELGLTEIPDDASGLNTVVGERMENLVKVAAAAVKPEPVKGEGEAAALEEAQRTGGLSGASRTGPAGGNPPKEDDGVIIRSMTDVLLDRQKGSGLF